MIKLLNALWRKSNHQFLGFSINIIRSLTLFFINGVGPKYFLIARLWRREVTLRTATLHLGARDYAKGLNRLNPSPFRKITQHKLSEKALLTLRGISTPEFLGFYHPDRGGDTNDRPLRNALDLTAFLQGYIEKRLCFKAAEGSGGSKFAALNVVMNEGRLELHHPLSNEVYSVAEWTERLKNFRSGTIIEEYLTQHSALARLNPDSVNTLRLIVIHTKDGFVTRGGMLRVGRAGSQVDNTSTGGLACPIDIDTGRVVEALDLSIERNSYDAHPDTGAILKGFEIPFWPECIGLANRAVAAFPQMNFCGIDIAVTPSGPIVIELNSDPDRRFAAHMDLPHAKLFAEGVKCSS